MALGTQCKIAFRWRPNSDSSNNSPLIFPKTTLTKQFSKFTFVTNQTCLSSLHHSSPPPPPPSNGTRHTSLLVEKYNYNEHQRLRDLLEKLSNTNSCPLQILTDYGDWTKEQFWVVIKFLIHASRSLEVLQVFDMWKNIEKLRINEFYYDKIIGLLGEENMLEEALSAFQKMKRHGLKPSLGSYNVIIHGFAKKGNFDDALFYLNAMKEANLAPETDTYDGLIQAYGRYKMYDEIAICVKKMELDGCSPDHITYNLLIREFSRAGLLKRMERVCQAMLSKKMDLQSNTLVAMLEAYARFGILDKMEKVYRRVLNSKNPLKDDLIRKLAEIYIDNYMFSRLDDLGLNVSSRFGATDLVWCLRLLSHACLLSRKGMYSIVQEMQEAKVSWNVTVANIIMLAYLKMKDFTRLRSLLSQLPPHHVKPDMVTVGILFDAITFGFDGTEIIETWRRMGHLYSVVEMKTDPLVLTAFGKGSFLRKCERVYCSLETRAREKKTWTYHNLIDLVSEYNGRKPQ
ncbi:pentatricopeptide repeat-containing protein At4g14190, chloroplastic [Castanea sativa]|uniref:pentatricopeptide repeat-containing protein At4g14190, chloroplastic n=1 Tax=Castanea sativa TaxID=21020 RepID=UPI003F64FCA8